MKSWLKWVIGLCVVGGIFQGIYQGCKSCERDDKEESENYPTMYKKACASKDFEKAYEIVDKMKKETSQAKVKMEVDRDSPFCYPKSKAEYEESEKRSTEAERYVVLQEAITVLENEGTNGLMRIVGIAKEHDAESWLYDELKDIARKIGDTALENELEQIVSRVY